MSINKKIIVTAAIGLAIGASSCKKYLNVNTNPNVAQQATVQTLLPAAQLYVGSSVGVEMEIGGSFFAEYWTQSPAASQFHILDTWNPPQDQFSTTWTNLYAAGENFYQLYKLADSQKKKQYMAIALLMRAYTFEMIADAYGDAPFSQSLQGQPIDGNIVNPKYDSQRVIYNGIIANIDSANKLINPADPVTPGSDDLIYSGDMGKWQRFANTLMLRILVRISQKDPAFAQAGITRLYSNPVTASFLGEGDDAIISYGWNTSNKNPLYADESSTTLNSTQNLVGSSTCIDSLNAAGDPRVYVFYSYLAATGAPAGLPQGYTGNATSSTYSIPTVFVGGDAQNVTSVPTIKSSSPVTSANAPVNLLTSWESLFLQAEVVARGMQPSSSGYADDSLWWYAIKANFDYYNPGLIATYDSVLVGLFGVPTAPLTTSIFMDYMSGAFTNSGAPSPWTIYPVGGSQAAKMRFIITQKWFAMCGNQGFEAWTEWRRTGYPDFLVPSLAAGGLPEPRRFTSPTSESTTNSAYPGLAPLASPVWWDIL